ncbi:transglycosylase SLT domain-containing protein [Falsochrobactrum sp. TDYN1]|uniref:Transglycosylase SLT domain-containing protein n=1 Tax=Falsochrobactrum tianjinense TaxID=2706015 RepID=A0A949PRE3_9HYPH|nr:transglycosylase SLT domain-containing protein [Falsochrobactrum sp. TDYN1]MBV2144641.1 transglycosylase SLT domain-containing protein [Falsochrobactrum sp. TDYN1]
MMRVLFFVALVILGGCATAPRQINNVCAVFDQRDGWISNWQTAAKRVSREYGVPVPILMATIYTESGFRPYAKPPRTKLLGFIPWTRPSSAYGYSQALDGTWDHYKRETGRWAASRSNFADAIHFIGWYHYQSHLKNGIKRTDAYNLYLAYYSGHAGYARGSWRNSATARNGAKRAQAMANRYAAQLRSCGRIS